MEDRGAETGPVSGAREVASGELTAVVVACEDLEIARRGLGLALAGYIVAALFPLSDVLEAWAWLSPWDWALGGDPLFHATEAWRYVALAGAAAVLVVVGVIAFARRDVRSA